MTTLCGFLAISVEYFVAEQFLQCTDLLPASEQVASLSTVKSSCQMWPFAATVRFSVAEQAEQFLISEPSAVQVASFRVRQLPKLWPLAGITVLFVVAVHLVQ